MLGLCATLLEITSGCQEGWYSTECSRREQKTRRGGAEYSTGLSSAILPCEMWSGDGSVDHSVDQCLTEEVGDQATPSTVHLDT